MSGDNRYNDPKGKKWEAGFMKLDMYKKKKKKGGESNEKRKI